ncbi:hypothetical protein [Streptomyces sp. SS]|uniref:hypothetical protein n=1 Tax=Streptomyces sp. SS TaxID=260742 RepID=UPI0002DC5A47|nr:hypothetical protein [Streptomyces sp. SS]
MIPSDGGDGGGGVGGTNFRDMSHQQMLTWLNEASSFYVGDAAGVLNSTGRKLTEIADRLVDRMKDMDWEGEAEKAFSEWTLAVAKSTSDLGTYSSDGAYWMEGNASAIAAAASAIPRYVSYESAKANLEAALKYRNDPDSQTIAREARTASEELATIEGKERANQQAAAAEMERLSATYQWSSTQMSGMQPPTFPPPPGAFVPDVKSRYGGDSEYIGSYPQSSDRYTGSDSGTTQNNRSQPDTRTTPDTNVVPPSGDPTGPTHVIRPEVRPEVPVDLGIDSVETLPPPTTTGPQTPNPGGPPPITRPDGGTPPIVPPMGVPPATGKGGPGPVGPTGPVTGGTRNQLPNSLRGMPGPLGGTREGISGGKPVPHTQGRPQTGIPRSTVIGNEPGGRNGTGMGRGPMGGGPGMGGPMGGAAGQNGISGGRRLAGETGGVVGGKAQRAGTTGGAGAARPFTPGGSGLVRGGTPQSREREEQNGERPDYLVEDEETWQQGNRRVAPPVID